MLRQTRGMGELVLLALVGTGTAPATGLWRRRI
jgi:hypothetical protein